MTLTLLGSVILLLPGTAQATLLRGLSLDNLCRRSELIVRGKVVARATAWKGSRIYTRVTLRVTGSLRSTHRIGQTVSFWRLGGRVGRHAQIVRGAPTFQQGDHVLVFLTRRKDHLFVTGMVQGRFSIRSATTSRLSTVTQALVGARLLGPKRALRRPTTLVRFEQRIRATLRTLKGRAP